MLFVGGNIMKMERDPRLPSRRVPLLGGAPREHPPAPVPRRPPGCGSISSVWSASWWPRRLPSRGDCSGSVPSCNEPPLPGRPLIDESGVFGLFASQEQREIIDRVQALMSLLEGHGHMVMDRIGARELVTQERMSRVLKARRADKRTAAFMRLIGLELKLRQYELGEQFIKGVEEQASWATLNLAWESQETLPTLAEISDPQSWLKRVA